METLKVETLSVVNTRSEEEMMMSMARGLRLGRYSSARKRKSNDNLAQRRLNRKKKPRPPAEAEVKARGSLRLGRCSKVNQKSNEEMSKIDRGDIVDIIDLLFTQHRDYLIKYNNPNHEVGAKQLAGKVIILYFMDLFPLTNCWMRDTTCLIDIYNEIQPKGCLEVVFVPVSDDTPSSKPAYSTSEKQRFEEIFSVMPWTAIPLSDIESRKNLQKIFGTSGCILPVSFVIDPAGVVLQCYADDHFVRYGSPGYPFSDEKIYFLCSEDDAARKNPSITTLLTSPERNYVIYNSGDKVAVGDLEDKVVGLYFYEESEIDDFTPKLQMAYQELAKIENFEIVLVYVHDTLDTHDCTTEVSFQKTFSTMPWLALPFKDPNCKKLQRVFDYPEELGEMIEPDPTLVIIGPHGKFMELYGKDILLKFGIAAYPFTRKSAAKLEVEKAKRLKMEMIWTDPNTFFKQKDGPDVRFSQLGKRIILLLKDDWFSDFKDFFRMLKARYLQMKGTNDEFEVVQICYKKHKRVADMPWLMADPLAEDSNESKLLFSVFHFRGGLLAFDSDGGLVTRTIHPEFKREDMDFPFHSRSLEEDAVIELVRSYRWWWE